MMASLEVAASIIAIVDVSAKVGSLCFQYCTDVKNAQDDIARVRKEADLLKTTVERIRPLLDGPNGTRLETSQSLRDGAPRLLLPAR